MEESVKTHKRKSKNLVDPGDLVSEKSLSNSYNILGQVRARIEDLQGRKLNWLCLGRGNRTTACENQEGQFRRGWWWLLPVFSVGKPLNLESTPDLIMYHLSHNLLVAGGHNPPLPWRHFLLCGPRASETLDKISRSQGQWPVGSVAARHNVALEFWWIAYDCICISTTSII